LKRFWLEGCTRRRHYNAHKEQAYKGMGCVHSDLAGSPPPRDLITEAGTLKCKQLEDLATTSKASDPLEMYRQLNVSKTECSAHALQSTEVPNPTFSCANSRFGGLGKDTKQMLRCLAALRGPPIEQLRLSVGVLQDILGLPYVSISVFSQEPTLTSTIVAVSPNMQQCAGVGVPVVIEHAEDIADIVTSTHHIMSGLDFLEACSPYAASLMGIEEAADLSGMDGNMQSGYRSLPPDWQALSEATDLHAFAAVPITHEDMVVGQLTVGDSQELCMSSTGANLRHNLEVAATWMSQWVREGTLAGLAGMLHNITSAGDMEALVQSTCTGLQEYFKRRMQLKLRVRVALLDSPDSAVVYEEQISSAAPAPPPHRTSRPGILEATQSADCNVLGYPQSFRAEPPASPRSKRESVDMHSRLRSIYHSTAVSSLEDLKNLTQTISANDSIREQLLPASLQSPSPNYSMSQLSLGQLPHALMHQGTSGLSPANSCQMNPHSGNSTAVPSLSNANNSLVGTSGNLSPAGSGMVGSLTPASSSHGGLHQQAESQFPRSSVPPFQGAASKPPPPASPFGADAACKPLDKPSPFAAQPPSPVSHGSFAFGLQPPSPSTPRASRYGGNGKPRLPLQDNNLLEGASSCHLPKTKSARSSINGGNNRRWSLTSPGVRDPFSTLPASPLQAQRFLRRDNSGTLSEDVLLHMAQEAEDQDDTSWHLVAHTMASLERTLLAQVMAGNQQFREGTWIRDVATYMTQPNRPGRDIVMSARSPPVASLILACMPIAAQSNSTTSTLRVCSSSGEATPAPSISNSSAMSSNMPSGRPVSKDQHHDHRRQPCTMAVYLTSATPLVPLQLQVVLRELQVVLALMCPSVSQHMVGELRDEWLRARESMLLHRKSSVNQGPLSHGYSSTSRLCHASYSSSQVPAHALKSQASDRQGRPPSVQVHASRQWEADPWSCASPYSSGPLSVSPTSPLGSSRGGYLPSPKPYKRSCTHYSRAQEMPQVAPLVSGLQAQLCHQMANQHHMQLFNNHKELSALKACELIACGGFSSVYKGLWQGLEVAIKVVPQRKDHSDGVREAVELAVMSTVSHPNMLGIQNFWVDVLVTPHSRNLRCDKQNGLLKLESGISCEGQVIETNLLNPTPPASPLQPEVEKLKQQQAAEKPTPCLVIVMELSDQGSLDKAIHQGAFWLLPAPGRPPCLNMLSVLTTLLEIAMALRHMHSMQLVHCDLKPGNVLLKSSLTDARRFTTKLCDFGLVKFRYESVDFTEQIRRSTFTGTVTHSPPEMLQGDPNPDYAYDVYAFGILMYEIVSLTPVYAGLSDRQVAQQVVYNHLRPTFSKRMNPEYVMLAKQCWAADPKERPPIARVVQGISRMLMALREASSPAPAALSTASNGNVSLQPAGPPANSFVQSPFAPQAAAAAAAPK